MRKIIFTKEEISDIINKYSIGISTEKICIDYSVSSTIISKTLKDNKIILRGNIKNIDDYDWAYNHDKIIKRIMSCTSQHTTDPVE